jgi:hypothetical protein
MGVQLAGERLHALEEFVSGWREGVQGLAPPADENSL